MSNYDYEDDDFDTDSSGNDLVKQLRKQLKAKEKELSEKESALTNLSYR